MGYYAEAEHRWAIFKLMVPVYVLTPPVASSLRRRLNIGASPPVAGSLTLSHSRRCRVSPPPPISCSVALCSRAPWLTPEVLHCEAWEVPTFGAPRPREESDQRAHVIVAGSGVTARSRSTTEMKCVATAAAHSVPTSWRPVIFGPRSEVGRLELAFAALSAYFLLVDCFVLALLLFFPP